MSAYDHTFFPIRGVLRNDTVCLSFCTSVRLSVRPSPSEMVRKLASKQALGVRGIPSVIK